MSNESLSSHSPLSRSSSHRFDNLTARSYDSRKDIPISKVNMSQASVRPRVPPPYRLNGSAARIPGASMGASIRKLSSPSAEFRDTPASYDIPSLFQSKKNSDSINYPNCSRKGSAAFLCTAREDVLLGHASHGEASGDGKVFVKTIGRFLRSDGSGDMACLGPGRHHTPPIFMMGKQTASRKNWYFDQRPSTAPSPSSFSSISQRQNHQHRGGPLPTSNSFSATSSSCTFHDDQVRSSSYSLHGNTESNENKNQDQDDEASVATMNQKQQQLKMISEKSSSSSYSKRQNTLKEEQENFMKQMKYYVRPNQKQAHAAVQLALNRAAWEASERSQLKVNQSLSLNIPMSMPTTGSGKSGQVLSALSPTSVLSHEEISHAAVREEEDDDVSIDSTLPPYTSGRSGGGGELGGDVALLSNRQPSFSMTLSRYKSYPGDIDKLRTIKSRKAKKKTSHRKMTAKAQLADEIASVKMLPVETVLR